MFKEITISTLGELIDKGTPTQRDPASGRHRNYSIYRGVGREEGSLLTSLDRLGGTNPPHSKAHLEEHILRNFIRYAPPFLNAERVNDWELVITAQHHGVPTRLLDWTYSPLIAAHFATLRQNCDSPRIIWQLDWRALHEYFKLKPLAFLVSDLDDLLREKGIASMWDFLDEKNYALDLFICMLEPPAIDHRIVAQSAAFTLSSTKRQSFDQLLLQCGLQHTLTKFVIKEECVSRIRDQLDLCTIDERRLFPDLDGIASELRRYYAASVENA